MKGKTYFGVVVILAAVLLVVALPYPTRAQEGTLPDLQVVSHYLCIERMGSWWGIPAAVMRLTFSFRNASSVPAVSTSWPYIRVWVNVPWEPISGGGVANFSEYYRRIDPWQTIGPLVLRGYETNYGTWYMIKLDDGDVVKESNEGNNRVWVNISDWRGSVPWCPGYRPRAYGHVFKDLNRNGRQDPGEPGLSGVIIQLWKDRRLIARTRSTADGSWSLSTNDGGTYSITAVVPNSVRNTLGGVVSWTTPSRYFGVPLTGGATGPYRFGLAAMPPPPPAEKPIAPQPEASIGWGAAVTRPVVVGQDPDRRGADVFVTIRVRPAVYTWYEFNPDSGRWERKQAAVTDYVNLDSIRLTATLTAQSRAWIQGELAARYPGARVRRPFWNLRAQPTYRVVRNRVLADGTHEVQIAVTRIPFEDPGVYTVRLTARTRGTTWPGSRVSDPDYLVRPAATSTGAQDIRAAAPLKVWLLDTRLEQ